MKQTCNTWTHKMGEIRFTPPPKKTPLVTFDRKEKKFRNSKKNVCKNHKREARKRFGGKCYGIQTKDTCDLECMIQDRARGIPICDGRHIGGVLWVVEKRQGDPVRRGVTRPQGMPCSAWEAPPAQHAMQRRRKAVVAPHLGVQG